MGDRSALDALALSTRKCEKQNTHVLSCEACEMVKTPDPVHMLVNFETNRAEACARLMSNVIVERTQANVRQPPSSHDPSDNFRDESKS